MNTVVKMFHLLRSKLFCNYGHNVCFWNTTYRVPEHGQIHGVASEVQTNQMLILDNQACVNINQVSHVEF